MLKIISKYHFHAFVAIGIIILLLILFQFTSRRILADLLVLHFFITFISGIAIFFLSILVLSGSVWWHNIRHIPMSIGNLFPYALKLWIFIWIGRKELYPWAQGQMHLMGNSFKTVYFNPSFVLIRNLAGIIIILYIVHHFLKKLETAFNVDKKHGLAKLKRLSVAYIIAFSLFITYYSWDWILSIDLSNVNTVFSWYVFTSIFAAGIALMSSILVFYKKRYIAPDAENKAGYTMARYLFAFSILWAYFWYTQFLLSWYGNLPGEVSYYMLRITQNGMLFYLTPVLCFLVPFIFLFSTHQKKNPLNLFIASCSVLAGQWLNVFLLVLPGVYPEGFSQISLSFVFFVFCLFIVYLRSMFVLHKTQYLYG